MFAAVVYLAYFVRLQVQPGLYFVYQRRLAGAGVSGYDADFVFQDFAHGFESVFVAGRDGQRTVAKVLVDGASVFEVFEMLLVVAINLVENKNDRNVVGFGRRKEAVDEDGCGDGVVDGDEQQRLVDVGGKDVGLLRKVGGLADHVVAPLEHFFDDALVVVLRFEHDVVADGYRVGAFDVVEAHLAFDSAGEDAVVFVPDNI